MKSMMSLALVVSAGLMIAGCGGADPTPATPASPDAKAASTTGADKDTDGDGVPDSADKCPDKKEDNQAPDPKDGCPKP